MFCAQLIEMSGVYFILRFLHAVHFRYRYFANVLYAFSIFVVAGPSNAGKFFSITKFIT